MRLHPQLEDNMNEGSSRLRGDMNIPLSLPTGAAEVAIAKATMAVMKRMLMVFSSCGEGRSICLITYTVCIGVTPQRRKLLGVSR